MPEGFSHEDNIADITELHDLLLKRLSRLPQRVSQKRLQCYDIWNYEPTANCPMLVELCNGIEMVLVVETHSICEGVINCGPRLLY